MMPKATTVGRSENRGGTMSQGMSFGSCMSCGVTLPMGLLDARPSSVPWTWWVIAFWRSMTAPGFLHIDQALLDIAGDRGADFDWLACLACYGPTFVEGRP